MKEIETFKRSYIISWIYAKTIDNFLYRKERRTLFTILNPFWSHEYQNIEHVTQLYSLLPLEHIKKILWPVSPSTFHSHLIDVFFLFKWYNDRQYWIKSGLALEYIHFFLLDIMLIEIWISLSQEHMSCFLLNPGQCFEFWVKKFTIYFFR